MEPTLTNSKQSDQKKKSLSKKHYLGIDPASEGAAILLNENGKVVLSFLWKKKRFKKKPIFDLRIYNLETNKVTMFQAQRFSDIGKQIAQSLSGYTDVDVACEDAYFRPNPKATIAISRLSGLIIAPIECQFDTDCAWTRAAEWRHKVLRLNPYTKRAQAKNASLKLMPGLVSNLNLVLHKLGRLDHLTDAAGVAYWSYQNSKTLKP